MPSRDHMLGFPGVVDWIPEAKPVSPVTRTPARPTAVPLWLNGYTEARDSDMRRRAAPGAADRRLGGAAEKTAPWRQMLDNMAIAPWRPGMDPAEADDWHVGGGPASTAPGRYELRNSRKTATLTIAADGSWALAPAKQYRRRVAEAKADEIKASPWRPPGSLAPTEPGRYELWNQSTGVRAALTIDATGACWLNDKRHEDAPAGTGRNQRPVAQPARERLGPHVTWRKLSD